MRELIFSTKRRIQIIVVSISGRARTCASKIWKWAVIRNARLLVGLANFYFRFSIWRAKRRSVITYSVLLALIGVSACFSSYIQGVLVLYFDTPDQIAGLKNAMTTLGSALVGATAIVFSLVMFAMQTNVERMSHGLFRKFGTDTRLLGSFGVSFLLAVIVIIGSILLESKTLAHVLLISGWCASLIPIVFLYAYRRALALVNPGVQLAIVASETCRDLSNWGKSATRSKPIYDNALERADVDGERRIVSGHDWPRIAFFRHNSHWLSATRQNLQYCASFARMYAARGDYESVRLALGAMVVINKEYIRVRGKTFFQNSLFDHSRSTDPLVNETLEFLRQDIQAGIAQKNEQWVRITSSAMAALCETYLGIDYASQDRSKTHTHLAAGYLSNAVQETIPHGMPDVVMEGLRLMGHVAKLEIDHGDPREATITTEKIALISAAGLFKKDHEPITQTGIEQLSIIALDLIRGMEASARSVMREVGKNIRTVTDFVLQTPDALLLSSHSGNLAHYYSGTNSEYFPARLTEIVNALLGVDSGSKQENDAKRVLRNLAEWSKDLSQNEKEVLLASIEKRSFLAHDLIRWIAHTAQLLVAASNAASCDESVRDELRKNAYWLISVLSWIPDNEETAKFVENFRLTETLFETALEAVQRRCEEVADCVNDLLLDWAFDGGKYSTGWGILERACCGLAVLDVSRGRDGIALLAAISEKLGKVALEQEIRERSAREIRERASLLGRDRVQMMRIDHAMEQVNPVATRSLLERIADLLWPLETRQI